MHPTTTQVERWYRRLWDSLTKRGCFDPLGYDNPADMNGFPGYFAARDRIRAMWVEADQREAEERVRNGLDNSVFG